MATKMASTTTEKTEKTSTGSTEIPQTTTAGKQRYLRKKEKESKPLEKPIWLGGHAVTLVFGLLYASYYVRRASLTSWVGAIAYKLALLGVWAAYGVAVNTQFNLKSLPSYSVLIATESVQYSILAVVWFFNRPSLFKLYPYMVISLLQLADEYKVEAVLKVAPALSMSVLYDELFLVLLLFVDTVLMRGTSGFALVLYILFYWLRILQFEHARYFLYTQVIRFDGVMSKVKNDKVQAMWQTVKKFLTTRQARFEDRYL